MNGNSNSDSKKLTDDPQTSYYYFNNIYEVVLFIFISFHAGNNGDFSRFNPIPTCYIF